MYANKIKPQWKPDFSTQRNRQPSKIENYRKEFSCLLQENSIEIAAALFQAILIQVWSLEFYSYEAPTRHTNTFTLDLH